MLMLSDDFYCLIVGFFVLVPDRTSNIRHPVVTGSTIQLQWDPTKGTGFRFNIFRRLFLSA